MKDTLTRQLTRLQQTFLSFTAGQKAMAIIGTAALLLAGFMVFRWASTPSYAPLYTSLSSADASSVIDQLNSKGVPYKITDSGGTIMVPKSDVYSTRITLSGAGIPSNSDSGYSILDKQGLSTSDFQEQTDFKRAMEAELAKTIEAINGVQTAVVHLALPQKQVFAEKQDPATASVLVQMAGGQTMTAQQVQAVVNLVASSIDGLTPDHVTVADASGQLLSAAGGSTSAANASTQTQDVIDFQNRMSSSVQQMLDRVLGPGNSNVQVTADLDFDNTTTQTTRYFATPKTLALSAASSKEKYSGVNGSGVGGVVGPNGQMNPTGTSTTTGANGKYSKVQKTSDNAIDKKVENRQAAPGSVRDLHVGVVVDTLSAGTIAPAKLRNLISSALGINTKRGDTVNVTTMPFNRTPEKQAAAELASANKSAASAQRMSLIRNGGLILAIAIILLIAWLRSRKRAKARQEATTYVVEQLRRDSVERATQAAIEMPSPAMVALETREHDLDEQTREEIAALVERQPEDVAALLRGWLVDRT